MRSRLFLKIFASYLFLVALVLGVLEFVMTPAIRETITEGIKDKLVAQGRLLAALPFAEIPAHVERAALSKETRLTLIDATGRVLLDTGSREAMENHLNRPEVQEARLKGVGTASRYSRTMREDMLYVAVTATEGGAVRGYVRLAKPLTAVREAVEHLYGSIYLTLFVVSLPAVLLAFLFARNITGPVRRLADFTRRLRDGERPASLMMDSQDEFGQLAANINAILEELDARWQAAAEERARLAAAFDAMEEGVLELDALDRIARLNRGLKTILKGRYADIVGKTPMEAFRNTTLQDAIEEFRRTKIPLRREITFGVGNGTVLDVHITSYRASPDSEEKVMMVFHDVTRLKALERIRADFIANVTHELRTPLTAVLGYLETIRSSPPGEVDLRDRFLRVVEDHARRLSRLVDDLLILVNLDTGDFPIHPEAVAVSEILPDLLPPLAQRAAEKGLALENAVPPDTPPIRADRDRLVQVLLNCLDNAVKFTSEGRITIRALTDRREGFVTVRIEDTGPGIPAADLPRLGERFYRVDKARSRELGGTGLGLSIVKHLMRVQGGEMEIESTPGAGTAVNLHFPKA